MGINAPTPASIAPGVSVLGIITSAILLIITFSSSENGRSLLFVFSLSGLELQPFRTILKVLADNAPPIKSAVRFIASRLFIYTFLIYVLKIDNSFHHKE